MLKLNIFLSALLLASSLLTILIAAISFRQRASYAKTFALVCLTSAIYSFGYGLELFCSGIQAMLFWNYFQYLGLPFLPAVWLILALQYTGKNALLKSWAVKLSIFFIPCLTLILRYTNELHHFYYLKQTYYTDSLFPLLYLEKGPWYIVQFIFLAACILTANVLYLAQYKKAAGLIRRQCLVMLLASILPWLTGILDLFNLSPYHLDWAPFMTTLTCILFLFALYKYRLFNLKPLAKERIFEYTLDGVMILDAQHYIIEFNPSATKVLPQLTPKAISRPLKEVLGEKHPITCAVLQSKNFVYKTLEQTEPHFFTISISPILAVNNEVVGWIITMNEITHYMEMVNKLNQLATKDDLTGINNRRHFLERSNHELERAKRNKGALSLIIFDLDHFKDINDSYGHQAGDRVLKAVAEVCRQNIRSIDILGRFGGEEFIILLPDTSLENAALIAERLRGKIEALTVEYDGRPIKVSASIGVTGVNQVTDEDINIFIKEADFALYEAKSGGRNSVWVRSPQSQNLLQ